MVGGHTHLVTDRRVGPVRALNPGSVGLPRRGTGASWMVLDADTDGVRVEHRRAPFDTEAVIDDLYRRRHPGAEFAASVLRGAHPFAN